MKKVALITGACINTGVDIVNKFASEGRDVIFTGRSPEKVKACEAAYRAQFPSVEIHGYAIDSLDADGNVDEAAVDALFAYLDANDFLVTDLILNAAHQGLGMKIFENSLSDFMAPYKTNVVWNFCLAEHAARRMKDNGGGSIVFLNSNTAYRAIPDRTAYVSSKGGQLGLMRALAIDLGQYNIRVNAVLPGMIRTDRMAKEPEKYAKMPSMFTPLGDIAYGSDIADAVWYFTALARNTTGAELVVDGGNTVQLFPIMDR